LPATRTNAVAPPQSFAVIAPPKTRRRRIDSQSIERLAMGADCSPPSRPAGDPRPPAAGNRLIREAVLWIARTGAPWHDPRPIRALEFCLPAGPPLGFEGGVREIVAMVDALGNLVRFVLLPGQRQDSVGVEPLIEGSHSTLCSATRPSTMIGCAPRSIGGVPAPSSPEGRPRRPHFLRL
jgi:hypothetical protein